jgi:hypothetical protein
LWDRLSVTDDYRTMVIAKAAGLTARALSEVRVKDAQEGA